MWIFTSVIDMHYLFTIQSFLSQTIGPIETKLGRNVTLVLLVLNILYNFCVIRKCKMASIHAFWLAEILKRLPSRKSCASTIQHLIEIDAGILFHKLLFIFVCNIHCKIEHQQSELEKYVNDYHFVSMLLTWYCISKNFIPAELKKTNNNDINNINKDTSTRYQERLRGK
jgi:hypothetical protein